MFCARCGKEIDNDSTFCPFCGQRTDEPVENGGSGKPKVSVKMPGKKVIGGIAVIAVVLLVVFGISKVIGGISNRAKSLPEKLFAMSAEDYVSLTREDFKDMLEGEGTLYEESDYEVKTLTTDDFMGYDCICSYRHTGFYHNPASLVQTKLVDYAYFNIAFETEEDFKEGQKSIKKYLEKEMVKKSGILKDEDIDTYLVECSDKGVEEVWEKLSEMDDRESFYHDWIYYNPALAEQTDITDENGQINEEALLKALEDMDYKMYKFVQVCYPQMDSDTRSAFPSDKAYTDYMCDIQVTCLPMTEEDYIFFAGQWGYDAISGKEIDIDEFKEHVNEELVDAYLNENASDDSERRRELEKELYIRLYMMENHNFDINSKMYIESKGGTVTIYGNNSITIEPKDEVRLWYIRNFDWDTKTDAPIDLSAYRNSGDIYCAVKYNYNSDTAEYFESELDRALYLADRDYKADTGESFGGTDDKRLWFMQNYNYDIEPSAKLDSGGKSGAMWNKFSNISAWDTIEYDNVVVSVPAPVCGTNGNGSYDWYSGSTSLHIQWDSDRSLRQNILEYSYHDSESGKLYFSGAIDVDGHDVYASCRTAYDTNFSCYALVKTEEDNVVNISWFGECNFDSYEEVTEDDLKALTDELLSKISFK